MVPLTLLLAIGLVVSVRNGRTSILGAVMAVSLGAIAPDGPVIRGLVSAVKTVAAAVSAAATGVTGVLS